MKIDPNEMQQVAAAQAPRFDMYSGIHKALRALMADTLLAAGRMDVEDELETAQTTQRILEPSWGGSRTGAWAMARLCRSPRDGCR